MTQADRSGPERAPIAAKSSTCTTPSATFPSPAPTSTADSATTPSPPETVSPLSSSSPSTARRWPVTSGSFRGNTPVERVSDSVEKILFPKMARIGQLMLNDGIDHGRQIIRPAWVHALGQSGRDCYDAIVTSRPYRAAATDASSPVGIMVASTGVNRSA